MTYDSTEDTMKHIYRVQDFLNYAADDLITRGKKHDMSKLFGIEKELFDLQTNILKDLIYGTPEYYKNLKILEPALQHHYENNTHHPQHYENGIDGMDLFDIMEMFFDWAAAVERNKDGDLLSSIEHNSVRFKMSEQLVNIFKNTYNRQYKLFTRKSS